MALDVELGPERLPKLTRFKQPVELPQPDKNACLSCVVANIMFMSGKMEYPDVELIDQRLGRKPGQALYDSTAYLLLLEEGFTMHFIGPFDDVAFIERGLDYLKEFYGDRWSGPSFDTFFTPEHVRNRQQVRAEERTRYATYKSQFIDEVRMPEVNDIDALLEQGQAVYFTIAGSSDSVSHAVLATARNENGNYKIYCPDTTPGAITCFGVTRGYLEEAFIAGNGIAGISLS